MTHLTRHQAIAYLQNKLNEIVKELKTTERNSDRWNELQQEYKTTSTSLNDMYEYQYLKL